MALLEHVDLHFGGASEMQSISLEALPLLAINTSLSCPAVR